VVVDCTLSAGRSQLPKFKGTTKLSKARQEVSGNRREAGANRGIGVSLVEVPVFCCQLAT